MDSFADRTIESLYTKTPNQNHQRKKWDRTTHTSADPAVGTRNS